MSLPRTRLLWRRSKSVPIAGPSRLPQLRGYAQPVNSNTSVDARLGVTPPPAPSEGRSNADTFLVHPRPGNVNDLADLLKGPKRNDGSKDGHRTGTISSVQGTAIGAHRRGNTIPTTDLDDFSMMEENARRQREAALQEDGEQGPLNKKGEINRESPHSIDQMEGRNELDERVLNAAKAAASIRGHESMLRKLNDQFVQRSYNVLPIELPYESTPSEDRKVPLPDPQQATATNIPPKVEGDDGILLLAFVEGLDAPRGQEKISVCTGFAISGGKELAAQQGADHPAGELVVSVAHTLRSSISPPQQGISTSSDKSAALAITRSGLVYPIEQLVSSLPNSDLVLLQLAKDPLPIEGFELDKAEVKAIKTLPISPYPAPTQSHLCVSSFYGFEDDSGCSIPPFVLSHDAANSPKLVISGPSSSPYPAGRSPAQVASEGDSMSQSRWGEVRLVEYKDGKGSEAQPGTYDSLETLEYKLVKDSLINPAVLKGETPKFLPQGTVSLGGHRAASSCASGSMQEIHQRPAADPAQGFGGYGVPNFPPPGSSGGPIVDMSTGSVVGVTRGCKMSSLGGRRGEGVPSEKIFEFFTLPGMGKLK